MKLKTFVRLQKKATGKLLRKKFAYVSKPILKLRRKTVKIAHLEVRVAILLLHKILKRQIKLRPRIRLISAVILLLVIFYLTSARVVNYIRPREADIKINGRAIVLSDNQTQIDSKQVPEVDQIVMTKLSPFEFNKPVKDGILSQGYSAYHRANDIAAPYDSPIHPLGSGVVEFAGSVADGKGNMVVVDHGNGLKTLYAHMNKIVVGVGNTVDPNSVLGTIGLTGHTTGPHVHLEVYSDDVAIDPASVLPDN